MVSAVAATVPLGDAIVEFDPALWSASGSSATDLIFTCLAPDCEGRPLVFARSAPLDQKEFAAFLDSPPAYDSRPLDPGSNVAGALSFEAASGWSGCRARDTPLLVARARSGDMAYYFVTGFAAGCHFGPEVPQDRFLGLLHGVKPAPAK